jgi:hypothetical protein
MEIYEIERAFNVRFSTGTSTQSLESALYAEITLFDGIFEGGVRRIDGYPSRREIVVSWITIQLFRLLFHEIMEETLRSTERTAMIYIRLRSYSRVLRIEISNLEFKIRLELVAYFNNRSRMTKKLTALNARVENGDDGLLISPPINSLSPDIEHASRNTCD